MIKKLLKHDFKKMTKVLFIIYIVALGLAMVTRLINLGSNIQAIAILGYVFSGLTYSAIGSILVNTFVHILKVFVVNFYKDESYLTHTLPVSKNRLLLSKYLSSLLVIICSVAVCFLCFFILFYTPSLGQIIANFVQATVIGFNIPVWLFIGLLVFIIFSQICTMICMAFTAVVKAYTYNHKRVLKGLIWFAIYYFGSLLVTLLVIVVVFAMFGNLTSLFASQLSQTAFLTLLIIALVLYILYSFLFYIICNKLFNKGVNVD